MPNEAAQIMLGAITCHAPDANVAVEKIAEWYGGVAGLLAYLGRAESIWQLIDRTPTAVLEVATGRTRAEWFGLCVPLERRYAA